MASVTTARNNLSTQSQTWAIDRDARLTALERRMAFFESQDFNSQIMRLSQGVGNATLRVDTFNGEGAGGASGTGYPLITPDARSNRLALSLSGVVTDSYSGATAAHSGTIWIQATEVDGTDGFTTVDVLGYASQSFWVSINPTLNTSWITAFFEIDTTQIAAGNYLRIDCSTNEYALGTWTGNTASTSGMLLYYNELT